MPNDDFDTRLQNADRELDRKKTQAEKELKKLKKRRGRLKGQSAPSAQIEGVERRIEATSERLDALEDTDPIDLLDEEEPTPKSFHRL